MNTTQDDLIKQNNELLKKLLSYEKGKQRRRVLKLITKIVSGALIIGIPLWIYTKIKKSLEPVHQGIEYIQEQIDGIPTSSEVKEGIQDRVRSLQDEVKDLF